VVALLRALPRPEARGLRWTPEEQWHVTLHFLGSVPLAGALAAWEHLGAGLGSTGARTVAMGPAVGRFGDRVLHVPVSALEDLAAAASSAMAGVGGAPERTGAAAPPPVRPFRGHVTLARADPRRGRVDLRPLTGTPLGAGWTVDELTLVRSHLGRPAARYEVVARHRLA
jgi:2'-5' RNA ligase